MRLRSSAAVVVSVLFAGLLAACGSGASGGGSGTTLTYWATSQALTINDDTAILQPELQKFTQQTGIKVNLEVIPFRDLYNRILAAVSSGQGPDVLNIGNTWSASLQATGAFLPFDDATAKSIGGIQKFVPATFSSTGAAGKTPTSVPLYSQAYGLFYNKKLFADAGIAQPPATWDEFVADAKKLTKSPNQWGTAVQGANPTSLSQWGFALGRQQGGSLFDSSGKPQLNSDAEVTAVKRYIDLMDVQKVVAPNNAEYSKSTEDISDFVNGKVAMIPRQSGVQSNLARMNFTDYGLAPMPTLSPLPPGGKATSTLVAGTNISVFSSTQNKDGALKLINFLTSVPEQVVLCQKYGLLPAVQDAYNDPAFQDPKSQMFKQILLQNAEPMPQVPQEGQMETLLGGAIKNLFAKAATQTVTEADVKAELDSANSQMKAAN